MHRVLKLGHITQHTRQIRTNIDVLKHRGWHMQHTPRAKLKGKGLHHDVLYVTTVLYSTRSDVRNYVASVLVYLF